MRTLKRMVRSNKQLSQVVNRVHECEQNGGLYTLGSRHPQFHSHGQSKWIRLRDFRISDVSGDNCFLLKNGSIVKILDVIQQDNSLAL